LSNNINIVKRNGKKVPLDILKIRKTLEKASEDISNIDILEIERDSHLIFRDGMSTSEIQKTLKQTVNDKIKVESPNYTYLGARLELQDLVKEAGRYSKYKSLKEVIDKGVSQNIYIQDLKYKYDLDILDKFIDTSRDNLLTYYGVITFKDRYAKYNLDGTLLEMPQHFFMRVAMAVAIIEESKGFLDDNLIIKVRELNPMLSDDNIYKHCWAITFYNELSNIRLLGSTPVLSNAGTPYGMLIACFVSTVGDTLESRTRASHNFAISSSYGGGVGDDITDIRANGSSLRNFKKGANGIIPYIKTEQGNTMQYNQAGTRNGSHAFSIVPYHLDLFDFIELKKQSGEENRRVKGKGIYPELFFPDLFFERLLDGKDVVGIEVPNEDTQTIFLKEMLDSELFQNSVSPLTMILGKDIVGKPFVTDLKKLPHLLIAGTTGSGKSVGINSMILSLLYKNSPDNLRLVMIDPKMLEFSMYNDIPHLLTPVITKAADAINALANMVSEMERRYTLMSKTKTKNIENYNEKAQKEGYETMPYIVVVIDELADLMMTSGKDVEYSIARLAQMARASGIHLIVATQRPSVDVVTGLIKANLPSRLSYKVGQKIDSKIILDSMGAESLLGRGDMLFTPPGMSGLVRIHAPWSTEAEIEKVVEFLKDQRTVSYDMNFIKDRASSASANGNSNSSDNIELDELYEDAKEIVLTEKKTSISYIQRRLRIGYNRAATIVEQLEQMGILSEVNAKGNREILS
jgi:hypothetical protein